MNFRFILYCLCFFVGSLSTHYFSQNKLLKMQLQMATKQEQVLKGKDATINLLIKEGNKLHSSNIVIANDVTRLQQHLKASNRKLLDTSRTEDQRLARCQGLLSESIGLLKEGVDISSRVALKKDSIINNSQ